VAFNTRWLLKPVEKFMGRSVPQINLAGGGGNSDVWCQIFADVLNVEVRQVKDPIQANARGAAFIAAAGLGEIALKDATGLVQFKRTYSPTPQHRAVYDNRYEVFVEIYRQMKSVYRKLNHSRSGS
jgi:xylulokinase